MGIYYSLSEAFRYPFPGRLGVVSGVLDQISDEAIRKPYAVFLRKVKTLSQGEWEELFTRTLDLSPLTAPYLGFQTWGESYPRGNFMALMNRAQREYHIDTDGELPDHLVPVLRYLDVASSPLPELMEILEPAVGKILKALQKVEAENPYVDLLEAVWQAVRFIQPRGERNPETVHLTRSETLCFAPGKL